MYYLRCKNYVLYKEYLLIDSCNLTKKRKWLFKKDSKELFAAKINEIKNIVVSFLRKNVPDSGRMHYFYCVLEFEDKKYKILYRSTKLYDTWEFAESLKEVTNKEINDYSKIEYDNEYDMLKMYKGEK